MKLSPVVATGVIIAFEVDLDVAPDAEAVSPGELFIVGMSANGSNFGMSVEATFAGVGSAAEDGGVSCGWDAVVAGVVAALAETAVFVLLARLVAEDVLSDPAGVVCADGVASAAVGVGVGGEAGGLVVEYVDAPATAVGVGVDSGFAN